MKFISFAFNKIQNVGANLLDHLKDLQKVDFHVNSCINNYVYYASKVPALIEELRQKCPDKKPEQMIPFTTTSTQASTTAFNN
jgi:hypothetical protein